jgi:hypothetical protein
MTALVIEPATFRFVVQCLNSGPGKEVNCVYENRTVFKKKLPTKTYSTLSWGTLADGTDRLSRNVDN